MKTWVMIPTYNESMNIRPLIERILSLKIKNLHILVVDDDSPDKTWKVAQDMKKRNVHVLRRTKDKGRGHAGKAGYLYCLKRGADAVIEMDADFSHDPRYIPKMLKELKRYDLVLGSRLVRGGQDVGRGIIRQLITLGANFYITLLLGVTVRDCNSGFRCFRRELLESIRPGKLMSSGPAIVQEVLYKAHLKKARIKEIPIRFVDRTRGESKLGLQELAQGYLTVLRLKWRHLTGRL